MSCQKFLSCRPNDFYYDPLFIVASKKDYYRHGARTRMKNAKYAVCPVFSSMFSDMPNYPRIRYLMRKAVEIPPYVDRQKEGAKHAATMRAEQEINGANRYKYFQMPVSDSRTLLPDIAIVTSRKSEAESSYKEMYQTKQTQTAFRESSAQTHPWEPDYKIVNGGDPELLKLDFLKWRTGLPPGMHEVRLIERARMKRQWEKNLPPITTKDNLEKRRKIIEAMERDEWAFREQEIQHIQDLRLELLQKMLSELHEKSACRTEKKMKMFCERKQLEKEAKLLKIRQNANRELRKLEMKQKGFSGKYRTVNIVEEFADPTSELYAPLMRHGSHPKRWNLVIDQKSRKHTSSFTGVENLETLPSWLEKATHIKDCVCIKLPGTRLCIRETKWTTPVLKHLYDELKNLRKSTKPRYCLREKIEKPIIPPETPEVECEEEDEIEGNIALIKIQSILRGRASQTLIYTGRDRCKKLIDELKTTHALLEEEKIEQFEERCKVKNQQREQELCLKNAAKLHEILMRLQGTVVGTLLDFLNKELHKLMEERKTHAMCLMAERERHRREAAEAGRRQKEIRRRKEHDEMFKQVIKIHQETVDMYLQDIITEGMNFTTEEEAKEFVLMKSAELEEEVKIPIENVHEQEEYIANLVHHFVLPEVQKQIIRDKTKRRQKLLLRTTHDAIYSKIEELPKPLPVEIEEAKTLKEILSQSGIHDIEELATGSITSGRIRAISSMIQASMLSLIEQSKEINAADKSPVSSELAVEQDSKTMDEEEWDQGTDTASSQRSSFRSEKSRKSEQTSLLSYPSTEVASTPRFSVKSETGGRLSLPEREESIEKQKEPENVEDEEHIKHRNIAFGTDVAEIPRYGSFTAMKQKTVSLLGRDVSSPTVTAKPKRKGIRFGSFSDDQKK